MEFALPELLSREEILNILYQRQLHISNLNELTHEELMRVYKTFVVPLSRRTERPKRTHTENISLNQANKWPDFEEQMQAQHIDMVCTSMDIDFPSIAISTDGPLEIPLRTTSPLREKRRQICSEDEHDDQYLSSATKRIKINS